MMAAIARGDDDDDDDDYDPEDDEDQEDSMEQLAKQRQILAAVTQQAKQLERMEDDYENDDMDDQDELMRQIYEGNLLYKNGQQRNHESGITAEQLLQLQAENLVKNGIDPIQALQMLKSQHQLTGGEASQQQQMSLVGNIANNLDIDLNDVMAENLMNGYPAQPGALNQPPFNGTSG